MATTAPPKPSAVPSLGDLYTETLQLNNENKISTKNAFDLSMIEHMDKIVDTFMSGGKVKVTSDGKSRLSVAPEKGDSVEEHRFHEASCTIEASAKIYACRVDVVHANTYKVLGGLSVQDFEDENIGEDGKPGAAKKRRIVGVNTLERNEANITQTHIDADEQNDPMFKRMAQSFDAGGAKGLLLSHLPVAEDLSLVFNCDVPMSKAAETAQTVFKEGPQDFAVNELGLGDPVDFLEKIKGARCLPEFDAYRRQLIGNKEDNYELPKEFRSILNCGMGDSLEGDVLPPPSMEDFGLDTDPPAVDDMCPAGDSDMPEPAWNEPGQGAPMAPIADAHGAQVVHHVDGKAVNVDGGKEAFDELFSKFCSGGLNQFAYFDQCWAPHPREKDAKGVLMDGTPFGPGDGQLAQPAREKGDKAPKKPLFDLEGLDQPLKPIETEPSCRHQLNEKAAQWQLYKDVPPYMIDRITMPSWPTATKNNFTCLGLRHNLLVRLVKKPPPPGEGPFSFDELYSTVLIQNHEEYPWLAAASRRANNSRGDENDDIVCGDHEMCLGEDGGVEDFDAHGLPAHLDVDPQDLFLQPNDTVIPECEQDDFGDGDEDMGLGPGFDFDLADKPTIVGSTDIGYSRNSKFVDVKLVKKHLWDCISEDLAEAKTANKEKMETSFQGLVTRCLSRLPRSECENLSIQVCFICALHLCNEKNVEIQLGDTPLGNFTVVGIP
jgi:hypothetical protein